MPERTTDGKLLTELARLSERLESHYDKLTGRLDSQDDALSALGRDLKSNAHLLTGNGSPERGIVVRLDRIEQSGKRRDALLKVLVGAVISGIVGLVFAFVKLYLKNP